MVRLTDEQIGDSLDLEREYTYPCSDGSLLTTIDCRPAIKAQLRAVVEDLDRRAQYERGNGFIAFAIFLEGLKKEYEAELEKAT